MTLLDLAQKHGTYRKHGGKHGGEWAGACPLCGGQEKQDSDRFRIWPHQGEHGTWWCRRCDRGGDAIQFLRDVEGLSYRDACAALGVEMTESRATSHEPRAAWTPRTCPPPSAVWQEHAAKLPIAAPDYQWLADRGITANVIDHARLGYLQTDLYRHRTAWGLPEEFKDDGTPKKLWIPRGLVIPLHDAEGRLLRLRIRRPEGEPRYFVVPGSSTAPYIAPVPSAQRPAPSAAVVVESELDALTLAGIAPASVAIIAMGNSSARPDADTHALLTTCKRILVALDTDAAGRDCATWWPKQYPQAVRWPIPGHKDPGEAHAAGFNLSVWLRAGLPPVCLLPDRPQPAEAPRRDYAALVSALYTELEEHRPHGCYAWLQEHRPDILATITATERDLDAACETGAGFDRLLSLVKRMYHRSWQVYREAQRPQPPKDLPPLPEEPPHIQEELF